MSDSVSDSVSDPVSDTPSHLDLLAAARSLRHAAVDGERDAVHLELSRLRTALMHHLDAEQEETESLAGPLGQLTRDGQRRLVRKLNELLFRDTDDDTCTCVVRAAEVDLLLRRQVKLEATALRAGQKEPRGGIETA